MVVPLGPGSFPIFPPFLTAAYPEPSASQRPLTGQLLGLWKFSPRAARAIPVLAGVRVELCSVVILVGRWPFGVMAAHRTRGCCRLCAAAPTSPSAGTADPPFRKGAQILENSLCLSFLVIYRNAVFPGQTRTVLANSGVSELTLCMCHFLPPSASAFVESSWSVDSAGPLYSCPAFLGFLTPSCRPAIRGSGIWTNMESFI